jgi:steroid delta-isomerase-like uncharacterized protein
VECRARDEGDDRCPRKDPPSDGPVTETPPGDRRGSPSDGRLLALHPEQWQELRRAPHGLALAAVDEALRFEPITPFTARITVNEIEYRGVTFPAGTIVLVSAWQAHRDGVEPDEFDITADRDRARVLTFGAGIHYCVGANLTRAEIQEGLAFLAERVEAAELAGEPESGTPSGIYGLDTLPLRLANAALDATDRLPYYDNRSVAISTPTEREGLALSDNIEIITRFEHAFRAGDQATIDEFCHPGLVDHNPAPDEEPTLAGFKQKVAGFKAIFPDLEEDLQDIIASGDTVATRWVVTGSQQQQFMGIPASGQTIRVEGMNFYRLKDGRVTDIWTQFDGVAMMQQLGAIPA